MRVPAILQRRKRSGPLEKSSSLADKEHSSSKRPKLIVAEQPNIQTFLGKLSKDRRVLLLKPASLPSRPLSTLISLAPEATSTYQVAPTISVVPVPDPHNPPYVCDSCDESFEDRSALIVHRTEKSILRTRAALRQPTVKYGCDTCARLFSNKGTLLRHRKSCSVVELESQAGAPVVRRSRRRPEAEPNEESDKPVACEQCGKVFKLLKYLRVHAATAHEQAVLCQLCGVNCSSRPELRAHMAEKHQDDCNEACPTCGKSFYSRQSLKVHLRAHVRDTRPGCVCDRCGKSFRHDVYLQRHVQSVHVEMREPKRYRCDECGYESPYKSCFRKHVFKHTGEDQVSCAVCGARVRCSYLKIHARIHTGEKPEICEYCGKAFSARKYLNKHLVTHTGEKPYQCHVCDKRYTQRGTLTMHYRKHHPHATATPKRQLAQKAMMEEIEQAVLHADQQVEIHEGVRTEQTDEALDNIDQQIRDHFVDAEVINEEGELDMEEGEILIDNNVIEETSENFCVKIKPEMQESETEGGIIAD